LILTVYLQPFRAIYVRLPIKTAATKL